MKNIIISILITAASVFATFAQKPMDKFQIQVDGLGCPFCAYGLEKKFKEFKGIKNVQIEIETGDFQFTYPAEKALTMDAVVAKVKKAGYTPKSAKIERAEGEEESFVVPQNSDVATKNSKTASITVKGNCEMCKARIETAALSTKGVEKALWNVATKKLELVYNKEKTSVEKISKSIVAEGHDTEKIEAKTAIYEALPACCSYRDPNSKDH